MPIQSFRVFNDPATLVPLFDFQLAPDEVHYLTPCPDEVVVDGHTYKPFPILLDELRDDGKGSIATTRLTVSDVEGLISSRMKQITTPIDGNPVRFRLYSIESASVVYEEHREIILIASITDQTITFDLGMFHPSAIKLLQEKFLRDFCWNRYKGRGCWIKRSDGSFIAPSWFAAGDPDSCTHKLSDCDRHNNSGASGNPGRFNSFPGIPGTGGFV